MDNLKLFALTFATYGTTENYSSAMRMEFGVDKCAVIYVKRREIVECVGTQISNSTNLRTFSTFETYKYSGMSGVLGSNVTHVKQSLKGRFVRCLTKVLTVFVCLLSDRNKVRAFSGIDALIQHTQMDSE